MSEFHDYWRYAHILLFVFWLGADVGVYLTMIFVKDAKLAFETRATLIKLAFYIDLFPRACFALLIPVGVELASSLGLFAAGPGERSLAWVVGVGWATLHLLVVLRKGTPLAQTLRRINVWFEAVAGLVFVAIGAYLLVAGISFDAPWFATKLILFGFIFWLVLGIDTTFQPFTMILRMGKDGSTPEQEAMITRATNQTLAWAVLMYLLIATIALLGTVKPF